MEKTIKVNLRKDPVSLLIGILFIILFLILISLSLTAPLHQIGDSSTYYMQITSIANDFDIQYQPIDIRRAITNRFDDLPFGLFLIKTDEGNYFYGKEFSYAFFAAPFFLLFGNNGILLFNAVMFWSMIFIGYLYLSKKGNSRIISLVTATVFFSLSTAFVYIFWIHAEIYNMFLITLGIFFCTLYFEDQQNEKYLMIAAFILGLATVAKLPNCLLFLPFLFYVLYNQPLKRATRVFFVFLFPLMLFYGFFYFETGSMSFYGGNRLQYIDQFPFMSGFDSVYESGYPGFSIEEGRISGLIPPDVLTKSPSNLFYYFFGRFSGLTWYYPLALFALFSFIIGIVYVKNPKSKNNNIISKFNENQIRYLVLLGIILNILFYVILIGNNYFGGGHALGNRYFYIFPAFLFLIQKIDLRVIIPFILIALFTVFPILLDPVGNTIYPGQHTFGLPYTVFPVEYSQINNLPLWQHQYEFPGCTIYDMDGNSKKQGSAIIQNGTSTWLIKPKVVTDHLDFIFEPEENNEVRIFVESGTSRRDAILNSDEYTKITIPLNQIAYRDNEYQLYNVKINTSSGAMIWPYVAIPFVESNTTIRFNKGGNADSYLFRGWSSPEKNFRWTEGNDARFSFNINSSKSKYTFNLQFSPFLVEKQLEHQRINIFFNGHSIRNYTISSPGSQNVIFEVDRSLLKEDIQTLNFELPDASSPYDFGLSDDKRKLGLAVQKLSIY